MTALRTDSHELRVRRLTADTFEFVSVDNDDEANATRATVPDDEVEAAWLAWQRHTRSCEASSGGDG